MMMPGAFQAFVRSVFDYQSARARDAHAKRTRWVRSLAKQAASTAEQRWEGEGGSTRRESALPRPLV